MKITIIAHDDNAQPLVIKSVNPLGTMENTNELNEAKKLRLMLEPGKSFTFGVLDRSITDRLATGVEVFGVLLEEKEKRGKKKDE